MVHCKIAVCMAIVVLCSGGAQNVSGIKLKRTAPALVERSTENDGIYRSAKPWNRPLNRTIFVEALKGYVSKSQAMKKLLDVLGLQAPTWIANRTSKMKKPPKYMIDLYRAVADDNGLTRDPGLLDVDTVRSIPNKGQLGTNICDFDLMDIKENEVVIDAELHVFQSRLLNRKLMGNMVFHPTKRTYASSTTQIIQIYQLLSERNTSSTERKLIAARRVHFHHSGWHTFPISSTVKQWVENKTENHGLLIQVSTPTGENINNLSERESLQPLLIVFTNNTKRNTNVSLTFEDSSLPEREEDHQSNLSNDKKWKSRNRRSSSIFYEPRERDRISETRTISSRYWDSDMFGYRPETGSRYGESSTSKAFGISYDQTTRRLDRHQYPSSNEDKTQTSDRDALGKVEMQSDGQASNKRPGRSSFTTLADSRHVMRNCNRYPLFVNFEELGWAGWIIHPLGYNAYHCKGECPFPLGQQLDPTNHATIQSIMHTLGLGAEPVEMPCCSPSKLYDINLLYFDQNDYVVLRRYKDMVAASCACR